MGKKLARWLAWISAITVAATMSADIGSPVRLVPVASAATTPTGYAPADLRNAYGLQSATAGTGETIVVVTAFDDPAAEADLGVYRAQYGLPACTTANGCFRKVNQTGGKTYPVAGWSAQDAQSLDAISAVCPNCHILLVEANSSALADLGAAENEAVTLGADVIDNDWSIPESQLGSAETSYDTYFNHPGVAITAPAGDSGYGVAYPAASPYVTAVGGTVLTKDTGVSRGWDEAAWSSTGAGCSAYEPKPSWQSDTGCGTRAVNDTSAVATNVAFYDSPTAGGWNTGSGTAISAAIVAGSYALDATGTELGDQPAASLYVHPGNLNDITSGSDGTCATTYLCTAAAHYDGPTGLGSPRTGWCAQVQRPTDHVSSHAIPLTPSGQPGCVLQSRTITTTAAGQAIYLHASESVNDTERPVNTANVNYLHASLFCFDNAGANKFGLGSLMDVWDGMSSGGLYPTGVFITPYPSVWNCELVASNLKAVGAGHTYYITANSLTATLYDGGDSASPSADQFVAPGTTYANGDKFQVARVSGGTDGTAIMAAGNTNLTTCISTSDVTAGCPSAGIPNSLTATVTIHLWAWQTVSATDQSRCPANPAVQAAWTGYISPVLHHYTFGQSVSLTLIGSCGPNVVVKTEIENASGGPTVHLQAGFTQVAYAY